MHAADICAEKEAIAFYSHVLECVKDEQVCAVITKIRADEERHLHSLHDLQAALCREGRLSRRQVFPA